MQSSEGATGASRSEARHDLAAVLKAFVKAKKTKSGKPQLIIAKTIIGKGIAEVQGTAKGHGEARSRRAWGGSCVTG